MKQRFAALSRFSLVGLGATAIYLIVSNGVVAIGLLSPEWGSLIAYLAGMIFSFLGQSQFTFRAGPVTLDQAVRFSVLSGCGIIISYAGVYFLVKYATVPALPATFLTAGAIALFSFGLMNVWVFKPARRN